MRLKLKLYNSLSQKKEIFTPLDTKLIKMYVCGPTVYDRPHIGNARSTVVYDVLYRILKLIYGHKHVKYVRNITDVDDKIIARAKELNISILDLTKKIEKYFHDDMQYLGCLVPNIEPRATEHVDEMIQIIHKLIDQGYAYRKTGHVYFDIRKFADYTKLSGRSLDNMIDGIRVTNTEDKNYHGDFVLWKPAHKDDDNSSKFDSPFGIGRPGWHIECSAMSYKYLGETFDIHGGGVDLIFPHHTNEIAQSRCAFPNSEFARYWVHNGFLTVNREKMSKSLGNFITVYDLIKQEVSGDTARLFLLSNHYKTPLDYNEKALQDAAKMIEYWQRALEKASYQENLEDNNLPNDFTKALLDDINTPVAISVINDCAKTIHRSDDHDVKLENAIKLLSMCQFLGFTMKKVQSDIIDPVIQDLINQRMIAKKNKNWLEADRIRGLLQEKGIKIEDKSDGTVKVT